MEKKDGRRDFLKLSGTLAATALLVSCTPSNSETKDAPLSATSAPKLKEFEPLDYFGKLTVKDDTSLRQGISATFKLPADDVWTFQVKTYTANGENSPTLSFAATQPTPGGVARSFLRLNTSQYVELNKRIIEDRLENRYVVESYTDEKGDRHDVHKYPLNAVEMIEKGKEFDVNFFVPPPLITEFPGYTEGDPIPTSIKGGETSKKVYAALTREPFRLTGPEHVLDLVLEIGPDLTEGGLAEYYAFLNKNLPTFDEEKIRKVPLVMYKDGALMPPIYDAPYFEGKNAGTEPWIRGYSACRLIYKDRNGKKTHYILFGNVYYDFEEHKSVLVMSAVSFGNPAGTPPTDEDILNTIEIWKQSNTSELWETTNKPYTNFPDPLYKEVTRRYAGTDFTMHERFLAFVHDNDFEPGGDMEALSGPDIIVPEAATEHTGKWYN